MMYSFLLYVTLSLLALGPARSTAEVQDVVVVKDKPEWRRALTHEELEPLYQSSIYPVMETYSSRIRIPSAYGIAHMVRKYGNTTRLRRSVTVIVIRSNKVQAVQYEEFNPMFSIRVDAVVDELQRFIDDGFLNIEDTIFILNPRDVPLCMPIHAPNQIAFSQYCLVPIFSFIKERRNGKDYNDDLLVPLMAYPQEGLVYYPHDKQCDKAIFQALQLPSSSSSCRRLVLKYSSEPVGSQFIEAEVQQQDANTTLISGMSPSHPASVEDLARWRYVMSCDTQTASVRFAKLLHLNSVVLKGASNWVEYFYGQLNHLEHFIEFESGYAVEAVKTAKAMWKNGEAQAMIERAQRFAYTYLSQQSRALYYEKAIQRYNALFGEGYMAATVASLPQNRALTMQDILALRMYPPGWEEAHKGHSRT